MSDIYKNEQRIHAVKPKPRRRRRRSSADSTFDENPVRRRRSSNSGLRRLLHLSRKEENESKIWIGALTIAIIMLTVIAIWQFVLVEHTARKKTKQNESYMPGSSQSPSSE